MKYEKRVEPGCISVDGRIGKKLLICKCKQHGDKDSSALGEENCGVETNYGFLLFSCLFLRTIEKRLDITALKSGCNAGKRGSVMNIHLVGEVF